MEYRFDESRVTKELIAYLKDWFDSRGEHTFAVIGLSADRGSVVSAALCEKAIGKKRVVIVHSETDPAELVGMDKLLAGSVVTVPGAELSSRVSEAVSTSGLHPDVMAAANLASRFRMAAVYAVADCIPGAYVVNTSDLCDEWIGAQVHHGNGAGDVCPIAGLTSIEVFRVGRNMRIPENKLIKAIAVPRCSEDDARVILNAIRNGSLDMYIRTGHCMSDEERAVFDRLHDDNWYKLLMPECYDPGIRIKAHH